MSNKMKLIALGSVIVVGFLIYKHSSNPSTNNDLYVSTALNNQKTEYIMWESEKSTINLLKLSSGTGISLVYEDIEWLNNN
ncbi:MAG: hypothetical protein IJA10_11765 [Lachnospiraceae bacterium]|nr:hypothetical protein [Lachnospiraceae bacterium]